VITVVRPLKSLAASQWFKLICGASYQHLPEIRNLALVFTLAGADCIDVAADPAVIRSAQAGIQAALQLQGKRLNLARRIDWPVRPPILMVSLNDGADPHFRKATLDPALCPSDCSQPCVKICPAEAIRFESDLGLDVGTANTQNHESYCHEHYISHRPPENATRVGITPKSGVIAERCYGCGRCLPVCPIQQISTLTHRSSPATIGPLLATGDVNAIEIHTQIGRQQVFAQLWQELAPYQQHLNVLAVSCGDGEGLIDYLRSLWEILQPLHCPLIWQTDGRPMSGDIGDGATRATIRLGQKVLAANLPGYVQLAGGTNDHTVPKLRDLGLLPPLTRPQTSSEFAFDSPNLGTKRYITGVAYGSFARSLLAPIHVALEQVTSNIDLGENHPLEDHRELLSQAIQLAQTLISPLKG
jgi:Fe-S-cluster-containing hydrogenase component 2